MLLKSASLILLLTAVCSALTVNAKDNIKLPDTYNYVRGIEAMKKNNLSEAFNYLSQEITDNPENGYAYYWLAIIYQDRKEYGQALSNSDMSLNYLPKKDKAYRAYAHKLKAQVFTDMEETNKALTEYEAAIKISPYDTEIIYDRANLYYSMQQYSLSDIDCKRIIELESSDPKGYFGMGRNLVALKNYGEAIPQFDYAIKLDAKYGIAYSYRAECYLALGDWNKATDDLISALDIGNNDKAIEIISSLSDDAFETLNAKLKIQSVKKPNEAKWFYYAGYIHENCRKYSQAIDYYKQAINIEVIPLTIERIADCYQQLGDFNEGLLWADKALDMNPNGYFLLLLKADLLYDSGDIQGAIDFLDNFIQKNPDDSYGYYRRGFYKDNAQMLDGAIEDYSFAIALDPDYAYAYLGRGDMYRDKGNREKATADYTKVVELDTIPDNSSCAQYAFLELGQKDKAIAFMDSVISHDKDEPGNYYDAACLYSRMGEKDKALGFLRTSLEKGYRSFAHIMVDDDLSFIRDTDTFRDLIAEYQAIQNEENQSEPEEDFVEETVTIPFTKEGTIYKVQCTINDLPLHFTFDTGAGTVSMSMVEANFMLKNDYLKSTDVIGSSYFVDANGDISEGTIINLRHVNFAGLELTNVTASVVRNQRAPLLLGQSVLGRLGKIEIDNENQQLKITHKVKNNP